MKSEKNLIFEGISKENRKFRYFLFFCENEKIPYDFMMKDPLNIKDHIEDFSIEELEISKRDERTDLAKIRKETRDLT